MTELCPKSLLPVAGVPFIHYQLHYLLRNGVDQVILAIGHRGQMIRDELARAAPRQLKISYIDEGENLMGTGGAVRLALDQGQLAEEFFILYGDSFLTAPPAPIAQQLRHAPQYKAMMTVYRNHDNWDQSNVCFDNTAVTLYQKNLKVRPAEMQFIDYGLPYLRRSTIAAGIPAQTRFDLADLFHDLSVRRELGGFETTARFYEIGSPAGLAELERALHKGEVANPLPPP
jgi:NDP-sugar pyrophosphorylase family protein